MSSLLVKIRTILNDFKDYLIPYKSVSDRVKVLENISDLKKYTQEQSAQVVQTTLYGYLKTRMGVQHVLMFEDKVFLESINIAKWNIYLTAIADLLLFCFSVLVERKNLKETDLVLKYYNEILDEEISNGLSKNDYDKYLEEFKQRLRAINWQNHHLEKPFYQSGEALFKWAPIADELKKFDKKIVLNSIKHKWNLVSSDFYKLVDRSKNF